VIFASGARRYRWVASFQIRRDREVRKMQDAYQPLDSKTGYTSDDGDDKDFLLDPIFPTKVPNYDFA
jgi:hypothetical protein